MCGVIAEEILHKVIDGVAVTSDSNYSSSLDPYLVYCKSCKYWFTSQKRPLHHFYASEYSLLMQNFFTDQTLLVNDRNIQRAEYQASLIYQVVIALDSHRLLEVGAGKGLTAHYIMRSINADSTIALHDPGADRYSSYWGEYVQPALTFSSLSSLADSNFDLGFTFFTLEHTESPVDDMDVLMAAMSDESVYIGFVPWLSANPGDLLVGDHCSHFTLISLACLLSRYESRSIKFRLLINNPLRGIVYVCSKSSIKLAQAIFALTEGENKQDFILAEDRSDVPDTQLLDIAHHYWQSKTEAHGDKREVLWGAGFYSKLIMLRHQDRLFSVCIDSNLSLVDTCFYDPGGRSLSVLFSESWMSSATVNDRLWLGVSKVARQFIMRKNSEILIKLGVEIAF